MQYHLNNGVVQSVRIGAGGVAATPVRARQTEAVLAGQVWNATVIGKAQDAIDQEFSPISDMRASASYRRLVLRQLLQRAWLQQQGHPMTQLEDLA